MEIFVDDIPDNGLSVSATASGEPWLSQVMTETLSERFTEKDSATLALMCHKVNRNVDLSGLLTYSSHVMCDRCLQEFSLKNTLSIHTHLAPLYESPKERERSSPDEERELVREDLEFSYYEGDHFDLSEIIREHLFLSLPMIYLCKEDCKGLCQYCGKNLNEGPCQCAEKQTDSRWEALKKLKI